MYSNQQFGDPTLRKSNVNRLDAFILYAFHAFETKEQHYLSFPKDDRREIPRFLIKVQEESKDLSKKLNFYLYANANNHHVGRPFKINQVRELIFSSRWYIIKLLNHLVDPDTIEKDFCTAWILLKEHLNKLCQAIRPLEYSIIGSPGEESLERINYLKYVMNYFYFLDGRLKFADNSSKAFNTIIEAIFTACFVKATECSHFSLLEQLLQNILIKQWWSSQGCLKGWISQGRFRWNIVLPGIWPLRYPQSTKLLVKHGYQALLDQPMGREGYLLTLLDFLDNDGYTPLMQAAKIGCVDAVRKLLDLGVNVNARTVPYNETALFLALRNLNVSWGNSDQIIPLLIENGADPTNFIIKNDFKFKVWFRRLTAIFEIKEKCKQLSSIKGEKRKKISLPKSNLEQDLEKKDFMELKTGIQQCIIPLPLCMVLADPAQLSGTPPHARLLDGWQRLYTNVACSSHGKRLFLLEGKSLSFEKMVSLHSDMNALAVQCSDSIKAMDREISHYISDQLFKSKACINILNAELKELQKDKLKILSNYFYKFLVHRLASNLFSLTIAQTKMLLRNFTQDIFSTGIMLLSFCLNTKVPKPFKFDMVAVEKTLSNITFPSTGGMEVVTLTQGIFVQMTSAKNGTVGLDVIKPRPQVLLQFNPMHALPDKRIATDSMALARIFFETFCNYQVALHPNQYYSLFAERSNQIQIRTNQILSEIYSGLLKTPPSDQELMTILKICSHFPAHPKWVDKFFLNAICDLPKIINTIEKLLTSLPLEECLKNQALLEFLRIQQRVPPPNIHSLSLSEIRELIASNKVICELISRLSKGSASTFKMSAVSPMTLRL